MASAEAAKFSTADGAAPGLSRAHAPPAVLSRVERKELEAGLREAGDPRTVGRGWFFKLDSVEKLIVPVRDPGSMRGGGPARVLNITEGLQLGRSFLSEAEQGRVVEWIRGRREEGYAGKLRGRTFLAPAKPIRGKGRVTIQYGCCYNYREWRGRQKGI